MREEVLAALLAADKELSRDEPEVEANLGIQMEHMGLETWSISVRRRIRDTVLRLNPDRIQGNNYHFLHIQTLHLLHY